MIQPDPNGDAKPYQLRQFLRLIEQYSLHPEDDDMADYHINVFWSDEDGARVADIPDLKGCSASGSTPEEAVREVQVAKRLWLETARERGFDIPPPRYRPAIYTG